uniref:Uncharacterized protein n=1 Tax=Arundo donax TaxID=35708 RepID=A0A0A9BIC1_ARUDO
MSDSRGFRRAVAVAFGEWHCGSSGQLQQ